MAEKCKHALDKVGSPLPEIPQTLNELMNSLVEIPMNVLNSVIDVFVGEELSIVLGGNKYLAKEQIISNFFFQLTNSIVEYILFDKLSARHLSDYFQKNINELEEILKEYKDAISIKDKASMAYAEYRFEKFIERSKVYPIANKTIYKQMPKFFLAYNLVSRVIFNNQSLEMISGLITVISDNKVKVPKIALSGGCLATALALWYSMGQSIGHVYNSCNGAA